MKNLSNPSALFVGVSQGLQYLNLPLSRILSRHTTMACWDYHQELDDSCDLETPITLLYDYLKNRSESIHLIGHGIGGVISQIFAHRYPERIRTLTLLAVSPQPGLTWHTHYYIQRKLIPCERSKLLLHSAKTLAGRHLCQSQLQRLAAGLAMDLDSSPIPHSLLNITVLPEITLTVPTLIGLDTRDPVVDPTFQAMWSKSLRPIDAMWSISTGSHFFHYFSPQPLADQITAFWHSHENRSQFTLAPPGVGLHAYSVSELRG